MASPEEHLDETLRIGEGRKVTGVDVLGLRPEAVLEQAVHEVDGK